MGWGEKVREAWKLVKRKIQEAVLGWMMFGLGPEYERARKIRRGQLNAAAGP